MKFAYKNFKCAIIMFEFISCQIVHTGLFPCFPAVTSVSIAQPPLPVSDNNSSKMRTAKNSSKRITQDFHHFTQDVSITNLTWPLQVTSVKWSYAGCTRSLQQHSSYGRGLGREESTRQPRSNTYGEWHTTSRSVPMWRWGLGQPDTATPAQHQDVFWTRLERVLLLKVVECLR
jgi:hypothetical protein